VAPEEEPFLQKLTQLERECEALRESSARINLENDVLRRSMLAITQHSLIRDIIHQENISVPTAFQTNVEPPAFGTRKRSRLTCED
jgi:hypothetical protein